MLTSERSTFSFDAPLLGVCSSSGPATSAISAEREEAGFEESQSDAIAPHAFRAHTEYLANLDVNVPRMLHFGQLESGHHFAFVEHIEGSDYNRLRVDASPDARASVLREFARQVHVVHAVERGYPGGVLVSKPPLPPLDESFDVSLVELRAAAQTEPFITETHDLIREALGALRAAVTPRETYRLLHGELHPSHILVRESDDAVYLLDIEGIGFGDLESEHTFLKWCFSEKDYEYLACSDLDERRLAYYKLQMHISGSRLLRRNYPDGKLAERILSGSLSELRRILELDQAKLE